VVVIDLIGADGQPILGIAPDGVQLIDGLGNPVTGIQGPVFFGASGNIDPKLMTATAFAGRSRVAILDVPPGTFTVVVRYLDAQQLPSTVSTDVVAVAEGAVICKTRP